MHGGMTQDCILGYFQSSLRDFFRCRLYLRFSWAQCQPSLRDYTMHGGMTQDCILGYFQSSLRDLFP